MTRSRRRMVCAGTAVALALLLTLFVAVPPRGHRSAVERIERLRGRVVTTHGGPQWLRRVAGGRSVPGFERATVVNLGRTAVRDDDLRLLPGLNRVERLNLSDTAVSDAGLVHLRRLPHLKALDLSRTRITGAGLEHLAGLADLEYLYLNETDVGHEDLRHLHGLTNLVLLTVDGTNVTETEAREFEQRLPNLIVER